MAAGSAYLRATILGKRDSRKRRQTNAPLAYGGDEALDKARAARPDLILLDVIMPDEDGFAVCEKLKADPALADVPVVMLTSLSDGLSPTGQASRSPLAEDYMEKPVRPAELLRRVNKFLSRQAKGG